MKIPEITHLQWVALGTLLDGERTGEAIRGELVRINFRKTLAAFYQLMARLEEAALVRGRYEQLVIDGQPVKRRWYKLTASGQRTWESTRDFYLVQAGVLSGDAASV